MSEDSKAGDLHKLSKDELIKKVKEDYPNAITKESKKGHMIKLLEGIIIIDDYQKHIINKNRRIQRHMRKHTVNIINKMEPYELYKILKFLSHPTLQYSEFEQALQFEID